jgi:protein SCO1
MRARPAAPRLRPKALVLAPAALAGCAALAALAGCAALGGCGGSGSAASTGASARASSRFDGAELPPSAPVRDFTLADQSGRSVSLHDLRGRVTVVSFLYSHCGAACVLVAQQIRGALDQLGRAVPVLLVSADPAHDDPASVRRFLAGVSLAGRAEYLVGPPRRLRAVWRQFGVTPASAGRAAFDRVVSVTLLDRHGRRRVLYEQEQLTPEALAHDIRALQAG